MRKIFPALALVLLLHACNNEQEPIVKSSTETADAKPAPVEFADPKYMDMGKSMMDEFATGNLDAYGEGLAENVVYLFSAGDSLAGKKAVLDYWKDRRMNVVETIQMSNDIWLPVKVNQPQKGPDMPGVWLMSWHQVAAKYKNGKSLQFWVHQDVHYNSEDKVDRIIMYMDRAPIAAALGTK